MRGETMHTRLAAMAIIIIFLTTQLYKQNSYYLDNYASELNWNVSDRGPLLWTGVCGELEKESASGMWL